MQCATTAGHQVQWCVSRSQKNNGKSNGNGSYVKLILNNIIKMAFENFDSAVFYEPVMMARKQAYEHIKRCIRLHYVAKVAFYESPIRLINLS